MKDPKAKFIWISSRRASTERRNKERKIMSIVPNKKSLGSASRRATTERRKSFEFEFLW